MNCPRTVTAQSRVLLLDLWLSPYVGGVRPFRSVRFQGALLACRRTMTTTTIPKMKFCQAIGSGTLA